MQKNVDLGPEDSMWNPLDSTGIQVECSGIKVESRWNPVDSSGFHCIPPGISGGVQSIAFFVLDTKG